MSYLDKPGPLHLGDGGALLLSVAGACLLTVVGMFAISAGEAPSWHPASLMMGMAIFVAMSVAGSIVAVFVGLPLTLLLERRRWERAWVYPLSGSLVGATASLLTIGSQADDISGLFWAAAFGFIPGGLTGLNWWFLHRRHFNIFGD